MVEDIRQGTARAILSVVPQPKPIVRVQVANPITAGLSNGPKQKKIVVKKTSGQTIVKDANSVGRNDPCPCGSGKKYKACCMRTQGQSNG